MALPIGAAIGALGSLFGGEPDLSGRYAKNEELFRLAVQGDVKAEVQLRCLSGINDPRVVTYGIQSAATNCGWKYAEAREHARKLVAELERLRGQSSSAGVMGSGGGIPSTIGGALDALGITSPAPAPATGSIAGQAAAELAARQRSQLLWLLAAAAGGYWIISRQARRAT